MSTVIAGCMRKTMETIAMPPTRQWLRRYRVLPMRSWRSG
jgi:hypothetical protein